MTAQGAEALPRTCYPGVWLWPGQALYAGPSLDLAPHSGSVWCLAVGVDDELVVTADGQRVGARSVLIPPRVVHHLDSRGGRLVSCYLDPSSDRAAAAGAKCGGAAGAFAIDHADVEVLVDLPADDAAAQRWLNLAAPVSARRMDPRIRDTLTRITTEAGIVLESRRLAADVGLSESRFLHLFRQESGTSLRRYRLWMRLIRAGLAISAGKNMTEAAAEAGFASPSHLSDRFKSTFGLTATQLLGTGVVVRTPDGNPFGTGWADCVD